MRGRAGALRWGLVALYAGAIFVGSSIGVRDDRKFEIPCDKLWHVAELAVLGALAARASSGGGKVRWRHAGLAAAIGALYGSFDEIHQSFVPGRTASLADALADTAGTIAGIAAWSLFAARSGGAADEERKSQ
ncbi:MAG: VanZ family protein [Planctomycetota bacterium]